MPEICPKCGASNPKGRHTCRLCGAEMQAVSFAELFGVEMFGPPKQLKERYTIKGTWIADAQRPVYHAADSRTGRPCLVHQAALTTSDLALREVLESRFLQQAAWWQAHPHPNLLRVLDSDVQNHRLYLITEPIQGISLESIIQDRQQVISEQTLLRWADQMCDALDYLHTQNPPMVLGCLSPSFIYVDAGGRVTLAEMGLIRYDRSGLFEPARGFSGYAAPEQREREVTPRSDIYTLGIILYQLITRFDPQERPLPPLSKYGSGFSASVLEAIARAYRREPDKRYASAAEMRQVLRSASPFVLHLPSLDLMDGQTVETIPDVVLLCATRWDEGLRALISGRIADWLSLAVEQLRRQGQEAAAAQAQNALERTRQAQEQIAQQAAIPSLSEIAHHAAFAVWLQDMGAPGMQPSLEAHPAKFDFGVLAPAVKAKTILSVRNKGQGYLTGQVESKLPWIVVPQPHFGCRAGETVQVRIEARGHGLPAGLVQSPQAIRITSNGGDIWIAAAATSSPPLLHVQPQTIDYGPISRGAARVAYLHISNGGGGRLTGRAITQAPWLRIRHPEFNCPAGASARIAVELLSAQLPKGAVRVRRALIIDSDSGQASIDIAWQWARPGLELDTLGLDLGSVERGVQVRHTITLGNNGTADLVGAVASLCPWLTVQPAEFSCAPGAAQRIEVLADTSALPGGSLIQPEAIAIRANAGEQTLSASVEVLAAELSLGAVQVDFGTLWDGDQAQETLSLSNNGSLPWNGRVYSAAEWLTVEPTEIECAPGHTIPLTLTVRADQLGRSGVWSEERAIHIQGMGEKHAVGVQVFLARPRLAMERRSLDFGLIGRTDVAHILLPIANSGDGELRWRIETQGTWLEATPTEGVCGSGETATVQLNAYALAVSGPSGQAWITISSNGGRADLPVRVGLSSPELAVEPLSLELDSDNYEAAAQTLSIVNRGVGQLSGTVMSQVPWLAAQPTEFACAAGMSASIQVQAQLEGLREGRYERWDALHIESNAGNQDVSARLAVTLTPRLHIPITELVIEGDDQTLILENRGLGPLRVQVIPQCEWLTVERQEWTIKPHKQIAIPVHAQPQGIQGYIEIRTADQSLTILVRHKTVG